MKYILPFFISINLCIFTPQAPLHARTIPDSVFFPLTISLSTSLEKEFNADSDAGGISAFTAENRFLSLFCAVSGTADNSFTQFSCPELKNWFVKTSYFPAFSAAAGSISVTGAYSRMKNPRFYSSDPLRSPSALKAGLRHAGASLSSAGQPVTFFAESGSNAEPRISLICTLPKICSDAGEISSSDSSSAAASELLTLRSTSFAFFYRLPQFSLFSAKILYCAGLAVTPSVETDETSWYMDEPYHRSQNLPLFHQEISLSALNYSSFLSISSSLSPYGCFSHAMRADLSYKKDVFAVNTAFFVSSADYRSASDTYSTKVFQAYINPQTEVYRARLKGAKPCTISAGLIFHVLADACGDGGLLWKSETAAAAQAVFPGLNVYAKCGIKNLPFPQQGEFDDALPKSTVSACARAVFAPITHSVSTAVYTLNAEISAKPHKEGDIPVFDFSAKVVFNEKVRLLIQAGCTIKETISKHEYNISIQKKKLSASASAGITPKTDNSAHSLIDMKIEITWKSALNM